MTKLQKPPLEARKARHMGATVYAVGVKDFLQSQLEGFADTKEHAFGVLGGFKALQSITDKLGEKSCIELKSLDPVVACVGGEYRVVVRGSGLQNTRDKSSVICRFKFTDNSISDETAITVEEKFITCPGVELKEPGEPIFVEISLNKGITFIANNLKFRGKDCGENPAAKPTEDKAGNPSKVNSQRLIEQTPEKAPEMPLEVAPKNLPGKAPEQAPGKPPQKPPAKLFKRLAARALKWLSKFRFPSSDVDSRDKRTEQEGNPEGGGEEAEPRGLEIPLPPVVKSLISTGSSSSDFPWIPVVVGAAALLFLLLLCCFFYLWCWCKKKPPDPCRVSPKCVLTSCELICHAPSLLRPMEGSTPTPGAPPPVPRACRAGGGGCRGRGTGTARENRHPPSQAPTKGAVWAACGGSATDPPETSGTLGPCWLAGWHLPRTWGSFWKRSLMLQGPSSGIFHALVLITVSWWAEGPGQVSPWGLHG
nr:uncharacterized protein LOC131278767 isoform X2 [Dasypus novemcinctus]